jgi:hypothetical protein
MNFTDKAFKDETVELDGNQYFNCGFHGCSLMYKGGDIPHFDNCRFEGGSFMFDKGAGNAVEFLRELYHAGLKANIEAFFDDIRRNPPRGA